MNQDNQLDNDQGQSQTDDKPKKPKKPIKRVKPKLNQNYTKESSDQDIEKT